MKQRLTNFLNALAVFAALLAVWQLILWIFHVPPFMLPSPWTVANAVVEHFSSLATSLAITAGESAGGLVAAIAVGLVVAVVAMHPPDYLQLIVVFSSSGMASPSPFLNGEISLARPVASA